MNAAKNTKFNIKQIKKLNNIPNEYIKSDRELKIYIFTYNKEKQYRINLKKKTNVTYFILFLYIIMFRYSFVLYIRLVKFYFHL